MKQNQASQPRQRGNRAASRIAWVNEPDLPECEPTKAWRVRLTKLQMTGKFEIEIGFYTRDGRQQIVRIDNASRSDFDRTRRELDSRHARLPNDKKQALAFVESLIRATPTAPVIACASPTFCNGATGFVMPRKQYGSAVGAFVCDATSAPPDFGAIRGELGDDSRDVLSAALSSPYLTLAILTPLASMLLGYVEQKARVRLLSETAIIHFAGESSSGKTTLASVARWVFGSPNIETDYEASDRGIAEHAYRHSNLALIVDDTESAGMGDHETWNKMQKIAHHVPRGRGRAISGRAARSDLPELRWTCFGISSGPETFAELAARLRHSRHGDRVRMLDIKIPPTAAGGIFGSDVTASGRRVEDSAAMVTMIENAILRCHGVLIDAWIDYLVGHDVAARVQELVDEFVNANAGGEDGLEQRFAKKFAVLDAAGVIGVEAGLLPWPRDWPMRAVRHCYLNSREIRDPEGVAVNRALKRLARVLAAPVRFPRVKEARGHYPRWGDKQVGFRLVAEDGMRTWIAKDRLHLITDPEDFISHRVFDKLVQMRFVQSSANATASRQFRVRVESGEIQKVRLWRLNVNRLCAWASPALARAPSAVARNRSAAAAARPQSRPQRERAPSNRRR